MGIKGYVPFIYLSVILLIEDVRLFNEIGPGERISLARLSAETFEQTGRPFRLAIDASIWQFQTQSGQGKSKFECYWNQLLNIVSSGGKNPALRTFFFRLRRLLSLAIRPLLVFDGPARPAFKRGRQTFANSAPLVNIQIKRLLDLLGIPYHDAPGEAEAECALLQREGVVDAVLSEDVDTLMFGCRLTLRNWRSEDVRRGKTPTHVSMYNAEKTQDSAVGLTPQGMLLVALMSGGDYNPAGLVGCGPKVACEAARAGFGKSLCKLSASDTEGIKAWREGLIHELRTNESRYFKTKHKALRITDDFPDRTVWNSYRHPTVSSTAQLEQLKGRLDWGKGIDIPGLREYVRHTFDWRFRAQAIKLIRVISEAQLINLLVLRDRQWFDGDQPGGESGVASGTGAIESVRGRRIDSSTDGKPELRVSHLPMELVGIDLDAEESGSEVNVLVETSSGTGSAEESEAPPQTRQTRKRAASTWDPHQAQTMWICEVFVRKAAPGLVRAWEDEQQKLAELAKEKERAKASKAAAKARKTRGGMKEGAMRQFMGVAKSAAGSKDMSAAPPKRPSGNAPSKPETKAAEPVRRSGRKAAASQQQKGDPGKTSATPWTLSKRRSGTFDLPALPQPSGNYPPDEIRRRRRSSEGIELLSSSLPPTPGLQRPPAHAPGDSSQDGVQQDMKRSVMLRDSLDGAWKVTTEPVVTEKKKKSTRGPRAWTGVDVVDLT